MAHHLEDAGLPATATPEVRDPVHGSEPVPRASTRYTRDPDDAAAARESIERTRSRMSGTIDEIEEELKRKRERIEDRMDVLAPVRENPAAAIGIAFGVSLLMGLLSGGNDEEEDHLEDELEDALARAAVWETRAARLQRINEAQQKEVEALRARALYRRHFGEVDMGNGDLRDAEDDDTPSLMHRARSGLSSRAATAEQFASVAAGTIRDFINARRR